VDVSDMNRDALERQIRAQLRAVLRQAEFAVFDLDWAFAIVVAVANAPPAQLCVNAHFELPHFDARKIDPPRGCGL
jgi:hypothetical protein